MCQLIFRSVHWSIVKRYRDFEAFHRQLLGEIPPEDEFLVPELPKKRWFEKQRWINRYSPTLTIDFSFFVIFVVVRFDDTYSRNRRLALQDYLRTITRTFPFRDKTDLFVEFLEIPPEALDHEPNLVYQEPVRMEPDYENVIPVDDHEFSNRRVDAGNIEEDDQYDNGLEDNDQRVEDCTPSDYNGENQNELSEDDEEEDDVANKATSVLVDTPDSDDES